MLGSVLLSATGRALQAGSACIVPPAHLDSVDEENLLLTLHNGVEAQCTQSLELLIEEYLSKCAVDIIRTGWLGKVFSDNDLIGPSGGIIFVTRSHKIANDRKISSSVVAADVR